MLGLEGPSTISAIGDGVLRHTSSSSSTTHSFSPTAILSFRSRRSSGHEAPSQQPETDRATQAPVQLCDERLGRLRIEEWTGVQVESATAARAISLYLETDHPLLGFFDSDLFLSDLIAGEQNFCSPLLVDSLLCWAFVRTPLSFWYLSSAMAACFAHGVVEMLSQPLTSFVDGSVPIATSNPKPRRWLGSLVSRPQFSGTSKRTLPPSPPSLPRTC
jgi:hypothetical protein